MVDNQTKKKMSYKTKKSTRNNRLMRSITRTKNNKMYQLDQVALKKKKKRERERREPRRWCAVKVRMRRSKSDKDEKKQKSSSHERGVGERVFV